MAGCHDMKVDEIYTCEECGVELKVVKECMHSDLPADQCGCHEEGEECTFTCCGKPLALKQR
jgi:hypothetical protein